MIDFSFLNFVGAAIWHPRCGPGPGAELINPRSGPDSLPNGHIGDEEYSGPEMDGVDGLSSISDTQVSGVIIWNTNNPCFQWNALDSKDSGW